MPKLGEFLVYWREEVVRPDLAPATYVNYVTPGVEQIRELLDEDTTLVVSHWEFTGVGYLTGDTALALSAASRARERRQAARDAARAA
ncbi:MAG TPA: hypothetical protein VJT72_20505 [Pseudonocardiaceae bacterium]|nr:hypothetical protein [Pseudonocardiaceae bacterium]